MQDPQPEFQPLPGVPEEIEPGLRRVLAPNASPMTYRGTNTYLVGTKDVAVIDPGPLSDAHLAAILDAVPSGGRISHVLVTHAHLDHSPLAPELARRTGTQVHAFGPPEAGRSAIMQQLAQGGLVGGGEGVDTGFRPDVCLADGDEVAGDGWTLRALHTPGHMASHLAFAWGDALLSGDLVMGWATSLVSPPDGDLTDFMASLRRLAEIPWRVFHPGHGAPVEDPAARIETLLTHRLGRESSIIAHLAAGARTAAALAQEIYVDTPAALMPAATRNVLAHLVDLTVRGDVKPLEGLRADACFVLI